jgi:hypothetical protein
LGVRLQDVGRPVTPRAVKPEVTGRVLAVIVLLRVELSEHVRERMIVAARLPVNL